MNLRSIPVVYLAGGMKSGWQSAVKKSLPSLIYLDPRDHHFKEEKDYTAWDLSAVAKSDVVLGFIEKSNPNGAGLALEFGFGAAQGKALYYVEEPDFPFTRYFGMVRSVATQSFTAMPEALRWLAAEYGLAHTLDTSHWEAFEAQRQT